MKKVYIIYPRDQYYKRRKTRNKWKARWYFTVMFFTQPRQVMVDHKWTNDYRRVL